MLVGVDRGCRGKRTGERLGGLDARFKSDDGFRCRRGEG